MIYTLFCGVYICTCECQLTLNGLYIIIHLCKSALLLSLPTIIKCKVPKMSYFIENDGLPSLYSIIFIFFLKICHYSRITHNV